MEELVKNLLKGIVAEALKESMPTLAKDIAEELKKTPEPILTTTRHNGASQLGMSLPTFDALVKRGIIRTQKVGRKVLVLQSSIDELLASGESLKYRRH